MSPQPPVALTVAGSDSGGGAGVAADLRAFAAHGVHGTVALTVVTAQNTRGIVVADSVPPDLVASQIDAVTGDLGPRATKTGLLFTAENVHVVATRASHLGALVVDPVLVRGDGVPFLDERVVTAYRDSLFPVAHVLTPNAAEAALLTGIDTATASGAAAAAEALLAAGAAHVVVTGVLEGDEAIDVHAAPSAVRRLVGRRIVTDNVHGTGCTFSATIAARLASGDDVDTAVDTAKDYVARGIAAAARWALGAGHGPIDHFPDRDAR